MSQMGKKSEHIKMKRCKAETMTMPCGWVDPKEVSRMAPNDVLLVHTGVACAQIHALRRRGIKAASVCCRIEHKLYGAVYSDKSEMLLRTSESHIQMKVRDIKAMFASLDALPKTAFQLKVKKGCQWK